VTIPAELHHAVMTLSPGDQRDRVKVNAAARAAAVNADHPAKISLWFPYGLSNGRAQGNGFAV
jgi:hypothetical protein